MITVGAYEAKTHLSNLLERVAKGESVTITKHGRPVAVMRPAGERGSACGGNCCRRSSRLSPRPTA